MSSFARIHGDGTNGEWHPDSRMDSLSERVKIDIEGEEEALAAR